MTSEIDRSDAVMGQMLVLRSEDGAWYEFSAADLDQARITDAAKLAEAHRRIAADADAAGSGMAGAEAPIVVLAEEAMAAHRVEGKRAANLEASEEAAGYSSHLHFEGHHREVRVVKAVFTPTGEPPPGGVGGGSKVTYVPVLILATAPSIRFGGGKPYLG